MKTYVGVADAHGVESFIPLEEAKLGFLELRARSNRQRHAVLYKVELEDSVAESVQAKLKNQDYIDALHLLKAQERVSLGGGGGNVENSWDLIPNPKLDPWA